MDKIMDKRIHIINQRSDLRFEISRLELEVEYHQEKIKILQMQIKDHQSSLEKITPIFRTYFKFDKTDEVKKWKE